ncbi:MAG: NUDIX hydrolase [Beijerinckiaceae bacterium]|nr:NUDIX hydrolase [Beijerinckiaceae bacterium]
MKTKTGKPKGHEARIQYAALPFRTAPEPEVLLVSSRETKRWVIPKGWPMKGRKPHAAAAQEALEEAGLLGKIEKKSVGSYHYVKNMRNGAAILCRVDVFPLMVARQRKSWPERDQRVTRWFPLAQAAAAVREPELAAIIRSFEPERLRQDDKQAVKSPADAPETTGKTPLPA